MRNRTYVQADFYAKMHFKTMSKNRSNFHLSAWSSDLIFQNDLSVVGHELNGELGTIRFILLRQDDDMERGKEGQAGQQRPRLPQVQVGHLTTFLKIWDRLKAHHVGY